MKPIYVHYWDNGSFSIYNLTKDQFEKLADDDDIETCDKFLVGEGSEHGYVSSEMDALAKLCGFEVGSE